MFRCYWMTFLGENRAPREVQEQLTESPPVMTYVLVTLAAGAVLVGFIGIPAGVTNLVHGPNLNWFEKVLHPVVAARGVAAAAAHGAAAGEHGAAAEPGPEAGPGAAVSHAALAPVTEGWRRHPGLSEEWGLFFLAAGVFLAGLVAARWAYGNGMARATALAARMPFLRRLLHRKWFVDEFYWATVLGPFYAVSRFFAGFDNRVVDGAVNLAGATAEFSGQVLKLFQSGAVRQYALWLLGGAVLVAWMMMGS
jgi:NADH-quinone oxidoreductase subunit L